MLSPNIGKAKLLRKYKATLMNIDHNKYFFISFAASFRLSSWLISTSNKDYHAIAFINKTDPPPEKSLAPDGTAQDIVDVR